MNQTMLATFAALLALACEPLPARLAVRTPAPTVVEAAPAPAADTCRRTSPDCAAACALRAVDQLEYVDWFDRRCTAVRLGKNADKTLGVEPPPAAATSASPGDGSDVFSNPYR